LKGGFSVLALNLAEIEQNLIRQKKILEKRLQNQADAIQKQNEINPDRTDLARNYHKQNRDKLLMARAGQQLEDVENTLARLTDGSFGNCIQCKNSIHPERLLVMPTAALCIHCQQDEEQPDH
jgi:RNA polymerase-binding protein DksA